MAKARALAAVVLLGAAAGCLAAPVKPYAEIEGPVKTPDGRFSAEIQRFTESDGRGDLRTGALVRVRHERGPRDQLTVWVQRLDAAVDDSDATMPVQGFIRVAIEGTEPDQVVVVTGPPPMPEQRFRLRDGERIER